MHIRPAQNNLGTNVDTSVWHHDFKEKREDAANGEVMQILMLISVVCFCSFAMINLRIS